MIPIAGPWITEKEVRYVAEAAANGWYEKAGYYQQQFEASFAQYLGVNYAVVLPSCTSAIHLALLALGIGPGDEVIVPEITWIASAAPISYVGATPVFADIDERTWCLSAASFAACITPRTKAVIPVDLYGGVPDFDAIREIAARHGIAIIEDAAQAVGAEYKGRKAGSLGDIGVFSFHGSKTLTTGEGGMLVTNRKDIVDRVRFLGDHGRAPGEKMFWNTEVAHKYKMSSVQAALGLAQLERIEELLTRKRDIFAWYRDRLAGLDGVTLNYEPPGTKNVYWMVTAILDPGLGLAKEQVIDRLRDAGIASRPFFYPLSSLPAYATTPGVVTAASHNRVAYALSPCGINLPSALCLDAGQVDAVCESVKLILQRAEHGGN